MTVVLALCVFTLSSVAFSQEQVNSLHPEGKKDGSLKLADTTRILKRQGTTGGASSNTARIDSKGEKLQLFGQHVNGDSGKNIVESASQSSGESHGSDGVFVETNRTISQLSILNLNNFVDSDNDSIPDGWNSNTASAIHLERMNDGSGKLTINCQNEPVYVMKYFEVIAGTEYEILLEYLGQETDIMIEEFSANNQRIANGIHQTLLKQATFKQVAMKFRTGNKTRRILFKMEVSAIGNIVLNKLVFQSASHIKKSE